MEIKGKIISIEEKPREKYQRGTLYIYSIETEELGVIQSVRDFYSKSVQTGVAKEDGRFTKKGDPTFSRVPMEVGDKCVVQLSVAYVAHTAMDEIIGRLICS